MTLASGLAFLSSLGLAFVLGLGFSFCLGSLSFAFLFVAIVPSAGGLRVLSFSFALAFPFGLGAFALAFGR